MPFEDCRSLLRSEDYDFVPLDVLKLLFAKNRSRIMRMAEVIIKENAIPKFP